MMNQHIEYLAEMLRSNHAEAWGIAALFALMSGGLGFLFGYIRGQVSIEPKRRMDGSVLDAGITETDKEKYPLEASCRFVMAHLVASFMEGKKLNYEDEHGSLGHALFEHWVHAAKHHPNRVKPLNSKQKSTLLHSPAVFYSNCRASESFDSLIKYMAWDWSIVSEKTKNNIIQYLYHENANK